MSATSHPYTIIPVVSMTGAILRSMYALVAEQTGRFPASEPPDPPDIVSFAGKTANMNKFDWRRFYDEAFWPSMLPDRKKILLMLHAWSANYHVRQWELSFRKG